MTRDSHGTSLTTETTKVRNIARRRHARLQMSEREDQIVKLRKEGKTNEEIAEALGFSLSTIKQTVAKLIADGKIERRHASDEQMSERENQIVKLRKEGHSNKEISGALGLSFSIVKNTTFKLIADGKIERRRVSV